MLFVLDMILLLVWEDIIDCWTSVQWSDLVEQGPSIGKMVPFF